MSKKKKKRVLLVTQYFYPESFKSNDIAFELVKRGYEVDALVSIPNYPEGRYYKGYGLFQKRIERINGVKVYRAFQTPRGRKATGLGLSLNYLTYAFFASIWALFFSLFKRKYHSIIVFQTSPITQALPAVVIAKLRKTPMYLWVQDIWPNSAKSNISNTKLLALLNSFTNFIYSSSTNILISSRGFEKVIEFNWRETDKIFYFPNWSDDVFFNSMKYKHKLPEGFRIVMTGNLGEVQIFPEFLDVIKGTNKNIKWVFVGEGSQYFKFKEWINKNKLEDNVFLLGRYPFDFMMSFYSQADILLLTLKTEKHHLQQTVPSRIQSYLSSGKPILALAGDGVKQIIEESDSGYFFNYTDTDNIISFINETADKTEHLKIKGNNGRLFYEKNFTKERCIENLIQFIEL